MFVSHERRAEGEALQRLLERRLPVSEIWDMLTTRDAKTCKLSKELLRL